MSKTIVIIKTKTLKEDEKDKLFSDKNDLNIILIYDDSIDDVIIEIPEYNYSSKK